MSHTHTRAGRSRAVGSRGRGRGTNCQKSQMQPSPAAPQQPQAVSGQQRDPIDRMERRDAYTVIAPDERKRNQIAAMAKKEEDSYNKYKEQNRVGYMSYVGTVGGGAVGGQDVRGSVAGRQNTNGEGTGRPRGRVPALTPQKKTQADWRAEKRGQEEKVIEQKKAQARQKSADNVKREQTRQQRLDEDRRRCNEAFLANLEKKKKPDSKS